MDIDRIISELKKELEGNPQRESAPDEIAVNVRDIPGMLEHSMLAPEITRNKILEECAVCARWGFAAICVAPYYVADAAEALLGTNVAVCSAVGFPHGAISLSGKIADIKECILQGASEVDVSLNMLAVKSGDMDAARRDFFEVMNVAQGKARIKAVFEHSVYTEDEKIAVLEMVRAFEAASGRPVPFDIVARRPGDIAACWADPAHAERVLGWRAQRDLQAMCEDAWRWQSGNPRGYASA